MFSTPLLVSVAPESPSTWCTASGTPLSTLPLTMSMATAPCSSNTRLPDHSAFHSIYFFDPSGHRVELACPDPEEAKMLERLDAVKWDMLEEWSKTRRAPKHAAFLHEREFHA